MENIAVSYSAEHVQTVALLKVIQFAKDFGITNFVLDKDEANVINKVNSKEEDLSMTGYIIAAIK